MTAGHHVDLLQGEKLLLLEGAVYVPNYQALLLSDLNLGKTDTVPLAGMPVAQPVKDETLAKLRSHCSQVNPQHIYILGDLFYARQGLVPAVAAAWANFLTDIDVPVTLIIGNHDRAALGDPFDMAYSTEPIPLGTLLLSHAPVEKNSLVKGQLNVCGHIHPVVNLQSPSDSLRLPCFYHEYENQRLTLPAFGQGAGGQDVAMGPGYTAYVLIEGSLMTLDTPL